MRYLSLDSQINIGSIKLGRGNVISAKDVRYIPGDFPIYSSSAKGSGEFGRYGKYMFDKQLITWSIDGGGKFFFRHKHKFSVTNVSGYMLIDDVVWDIKYIYYLFDYQHQKMKFDYQMKAHPSVIRKLYYIWDIPRCEQSKIATILETVDRSISQTKSLIAKQGRIKTGLMQDLLTRGIDDNGNVRSDETHVFKDSLLGRIPAEWETTEIGNIAEFVTSGSRGWAKYYSAEGDFFIRIGNLTREHINLRFDDVVYVQPPNTSEGKRTSVRTGDILISITADLGIIGVIPKSFGTGYVNQHIALVRPLEDKVNPRFIGLFLSSDAGQSQFRNANESGAKAGLNLPTVRRIIIPQIDIEEQNRIVEVLDRSIQCIEDHITTLNKLQSLKTALMQDLFTGKKRVTPLLTESEVIN